MRMYRSHRRGEVDVVDGPLIDLGFTASQSEAAPGLIITCTALGPDRGFTKKALKYRLEFTDADIDKLVEARAVRDQMTGASPRGLPLLSEVVVDAQAVPGEQVPGASIGQTVGTWRCMMVLAGGRARFQRIA